MFTILQPHKGHVSGPRLNADSESGTATLTEGGSTCLGCLFSFPKTGGKIRTWPEWSGVVNTRYNLFCLLTISEYVHQSECENITCTNRIYFHGLLAKVVYGIVIVNTTTNGTGFDLNNSTRNLTNPVLKIEKNPLANLSNPLANLSNPLENLTKPWPSDFLSK